MFGFHAYSQLPSKVPWGWVLWYALLQGKIQSLTEIELTKFIVIAQISLSIPNWLNLQFVVLEKYLKNTWTPSWTISGSPSEGNWIHRDSIDLQFSGRCQAGLVRLDYPANWPNAWQDWAFFGWLQVLSVLHDLSWKFGMTLPENCIRQSPDLGMMCIDSCDNVHWFSQQTWIYHLWLTLFWHHELPGTGSGGSHCETCSRSASARVSWLRMTKRSNFDP